MTQREIKFRAWDNKEKKWLMGYEYPSLGGFSMFGECMLFEEWSKILDTYLFNRSTHSSDDLILMQYTGLKDKNGVEIYEGDVVTQRYPGTWEVFYKAPRFELRRYMNPVGDTFLRNPKAYEIIGNIYEHPHLATSSPNK